MFLIIGLGNIGSDYIGTRHNIGFEVVDRIVRKLAIDWYPGKGKYFYSEGIFKDHKILLLKPTTFMNNSGIAVYDALQTFEVSLSNSLVICDDLNLPLGKIRLRSGGSDGGHNGLASIIYHLMDENFPRLRIGIGNDFKKNEAPKFVLSHFDKSESELIRDSIEKTIDAVFSFISEGIHKAMNKFN